MVLKPRATASESQISFENDVEMYGAQTSSHVAKVGALFENDVEMYGAQTKSAILLNALRLRMM